MSAPEFKLSTLRAMRDTIVQALTRYTEENKKLTVWFYATRVMESYFQKSIAVKLTSIAVASHTQGNYETNLNIVLAYYQDFVRTTVGKNE